MTNKILRGFNCLVINNIKFLVIKLFHVKSFKYKVINYISPLCSIDIQKKGKIFLGRKCNILKQNVLGVRGNGILNIDSGVFINNNCHIIAHSEIRIEKNTCIGPNCIIMDHDHVIGENGVEKKKFISEKITIGKNVWIGANSIILKGVKIGDNSVIAAGSVVTKNIPSNSVFIQKRKDFIKKNNGGINGK